MVGGKIRRIFGKGGASTFYCRQLIAHYANGKNRRSFTIWYPSLQPLSTNDAREKKYTSVKLGKKARSFYKDQYQDKSSYLSEYILEFKEYILEFKMQGDNFTAGRKQNKFHLNEIRGKEIVAYDQ